MYQQWGSICWARYLGSTCGQCRHFALKSEIEIVAADGQSYYTVQLGNQNGRPGWMSDRRASEKERESNQMASRRNFLKKAGMITLGAVNSGATVPIDSAEITADQERKHVIHMVGTTHFDPVWLWTWDEAMASIRSTFRSALARIEEEPRLIYSYSCPSVFEWVRQSDPDLFGEIQRRVREGRWNLVEGWWLEPDCNCAAGESYARHGLYGQRYLQRTFGRGTHGGFNTDSFGHNLMLPQILKKSGIDFYVFGRPSDRKSTRL